MPTPQYPGDYLPDQGYHEGKGLFSAETLTSEIRRREQTLLNFLGELCLVYIAKTDGSTCTCYRTYQGQSTDPDCPVCFGSGFIGGYEQLTTDKFVQIMTYAGLNKQGKDTLHTPNYMYLDQLSEREIRSQKFLFRFPPVESGVTNDKLRLFDEADLHLWTTLTLPLKPRDIIVRETGERYRVKTSRLVRSLRGIYTHQKMQVQQIDEADSVYRIGMTPIDYQNDPEYENLEEPTTVRENGGMFFLEEYYRLFDFENSSNFYGCC